jgi:hypothetical protein
VLLIVGFPAVHFNLCQQPFRAFGIVPNAVTHATIVVGRTAAIADLQTLKWLAPNLTFAPIEVGS